VAEEFLPFLLGRSAVFCPWPHGSSFRDVAAVRLDGFFGVDRLVAHRGIDVAMAAYHLRDVRWKPVHHGIGNEHSSEVVR
jgi:hypothetical protein